VADIGMKSPVMTRSIKPHTICGCHIAISVRAKIVSKERILPKCPAHSTFVKIVKTDNLGVPLWSRSAS